MTTPNTLTIFVNTPIGGINKFIYKPSMTLPQERDRGDAVLFDPLIKLDSSVVNKIPNGAPPDYLYRQFFSKPDFSSLLNRTLDYVSQPRMSLEEATFNGNVDNNILVTLGTLFKSNTPLTIDGKKYLINNFQWTRGDWRIDTKKLEKQFTSNSRYTGFNNLYGRNNYLNEISKQELDSIPKSARKGSIPDTNSKFITALPELAGAAPVSGTDQGTGKSPPVVQPTTTTSPVTAGPVQPKKTQIKSIPETVSTYNIFSTLPENPVLNQLPDNLRNVFSNLTDEGNILLRESASQIILFPQDTTFEAIRKKNSLLNKKYIDYLQSLDNYTQSKEDFLVLIGISQPNPVQAEATTIGGARRSRRSEETRAQSKRRAQNLSSPPVSVPSPPVSVPSPPVSVPSPPVSPASKVLAESSMTLLKQFTDNCNSLNTLLINNLKKGYSYKSLTGSPDYAKIVELVKTQITLKIQISTYLLDTIRALDKLFEIQSLFINSLKDFYEVLNNITFEENYSMIARTFKITQKEFKQKYPEYYDKIPPIITEFDVQLYLHLQADRNIKDYISTFKAALLEYDSLFQPIIQKKYNYNEELQIYYENTSVKIDEEGSSLLYVEKNLFDIKVNDILHFYFENLQNISYSFSTNTASLVELNKQYCVIAQIRKTKTIKQVHDKLYKKSASTQLVKILEDEKKDSKEPLSSKTPPFKSAKWSTITEISPSFWKEYLTFRKSYLELEEAVALSHNLLYIYSQLYLFDISHQSIYLSTLIAVNETEENILLKHLNYYKNVNTALNKNSVVTKESLFVRGYIKEPLTVALLEAKNIGINKDIAITNRNKTAMQYHLNALEISFKKVYDLLVPQITQKGIREQCYNLMDINNIGRSSTASPPSSTASPPFSTASPPSSTIDPFSNTDPFSRAGPLVPGIKSLDPSKIDYSTSASIRGWFKTMNSIGNIRGKRIIADASKDLDVLSNLDSWYVYENEGGGDCLFSCIRDALNSADNLPQTLASYRSVPGDKNTLFTVASMRNIVAENFNQENLTAYIQYLIQAITDFSSGLDTSEAIQKTRFIFLIPDINTYIRTNWANILQLIQTGNYEEIINDLLVFLPKIQDEIRLPCIKQPGQVNEGKYWGDEVSIEILERILKIKLIIIDAYQKTRPQKNNFVGMWNEENNSFDDIGFVTGIQNPQAQNEIFSVIDFATFRTIQLPAGNISIDNEYNNVLCSGNTTEDLSNGYIFIYLDGGNDAAQHYRLISNDMNLHEGVFTDLDNYEYVILLIYLSCIYNDSGQARDFNPLNAKLNGQIQLISDSFERVLRENQRGGADTMPVRRKSTIDDVYGKYSLNKNPDAKGMSTLSYYIIVDLSLVEKGDFDKIPRSVQLKMQCNETKEKIRHAYADFFGLIYQPSQRNADAVYKAPQKQQPQYNGYNKQYNGYNKQYNGYNRGQQQEPQYNGYNNANYTRNSRPYPPANYSMNNRNNNMYGTRASNNNAYSRNQRNNYYGGKKEYKKSKTRKHVRK